MSWQIIGEFVLGGPPGGEHVASQPCELKVTAFTNDCDDVSGVFWPVRHRALWHVPNHIFGSERELQRIDSLSCFEFFRNREVEKAIKRVMVTVSLRA